MSFSIHPMGRRRLVALGQIILEQLKPNVLAGIAFRSRVAERFPGDSEALLDIVVKAGQQLRKRPITHQISVLQIGPLPVASSLKHSVSESHGSRNYELPF